MKSNLTYSEAYTKLEELVEQLEEGNIPLDKLASKVKQANELMAICGNKLRQIQTEIDAVSGAVSKQGRGKK